MSNFSKNIKLQYSLVDNNQTFDIDYEEYIIKFLRALIINGDREDVSHFLDRFINDKSKALIISKHNRLWVSCGKVPSNILQELINYCILHECWNIQNDQKSPVNYPQLHRFVVYGDVTHLKVLYQYEEFKNDYECPKGYEYENNTALMTLMKLKNIAPDTKEKLEYLLKTYTYEISELRDAYLIAVDRHSNEIVEIIEMQMYKYYSLKNAAITEQNFAVQQTEPVVQQTEPFQQEHDKVLVTINGHISIQTITFKAASVMVTLDTGIDGHKIVWKPVKKPKGYTVDPYVFFWEQFWKIRPLSTVVGCDTKLYTVTARKDGVFEYWIKSGDIS